MAAAWSNVDADDPSADRAGCVATLRVTAEDLEVLLSVVPHGGLDGVADDVAATAAVRRFVQKAVAYDVRDKVEVPRFMSLKAELAASDARALALARLAVLRDAAG